MITSAAVVSPLMKTPRLKTPRIDTARLTRRAPRRTDFATWAEVLCPVRAKYIGGPVSEDQAWFDFRLNTANRLPRGHAMWTVEDRSGEGLGFVLIGFEPGEREPELGSLFRAGAEGQGHATEAAAARDHALDRLRLPALVCDIAPDIARSLALARRFGATPEGHLDGCQIRRHHPKGQR